MRRGRKIHSKIALASIAAFGCSAPTAAVSAPVAPTAAVMQVNAPELQVEPVPSASIKQVREAPPAPVVGDPNPTPVITRMEQFYATHIPFEADVAVEHFVKSHNVNSTQKGKLVFDRRGRFQLTFANGDVMEADGGKFTFFNPASQRSFPQTVAQDHCPVAFGFAMAPGTIQKHMSLQRFDGIGLNAPGVDVILATPQAPHRSVSKLLFYVRPTGEVPRMLVIPPSGDRVRLDFTNLSTKTKWPGALTLPPGTQIVPTPAPNPSTQPSAFVATIP